MDIELLKSAFRRLLTYTYFDKNDMLLRKRVADFTVSIQKDDDADKVFEGILNVAMGKDETLLGKWLDEFNSLELYPKKVGFIDEKLDSHIIMERKSENSAVEKVIVKANIPVELLILDIAWIMRYGFLTDAEITNGYCWGNRLDLIANKSGLRTGNSLFLPYHSQYRKWWDNGLRAASKCLEEGECVTIVNFDISNYYHSVDFSFDDYFQEYARNPLHSDEMQDDSLTLVVKQIYERYWDLISTSSVAFNHGANEGKHPLCLSLMSSHIFANWYLKPLDEYIRTKYVNLLYYGRYVDDCMVVLKNGQICTDLLEDVEIALPGLFSEKSTDVVFAISNLDDSCRRLESLTIQSEKLFCNHFDKQLPQQEIDEYIQEQSNMSSEYRFLTDEEDCNNNNLTHLTLSSALEADDEDGSRFKVLEANRFKLSVYLSKLALRLAKYGPQDDKLQKEVDKIFKYFQGYLLVKHYLLWEKILTIFVLADHNDSLIEIYDRVLQAISLTRANYGVFMSCNNRDGDELLRNCLREHLEESRTMALSLGSAKNGVDMRYVNTFLVRMHYNRYPLQELSDSFVETGCNMPFEQLYYDTLKLTYKWMPYYVYYYEIVLFLSLGKPFDPNIFEEAFQIYCSINHVGSLPMFTCKSFFRIGSKDLDGIEINSDMGQEPNDKDVLSVAMVGMNIVPHDATDVIDQRGNVIPAKVKLMDRVLDRIEKVPETDIFMMPEVSLPVYMLKSFCHRSAIREIAYIAGMEYCVVAGAVYNYIVTCLPITINGQLDSVPVLRLKNYYAPDEIADIEKKQLKVPHNTKPWQNLFHWRGHLFTDCYCFELSNIRDRSYFFNVVDAVYCPVFNKDTYYFNNIAESMARDMHCYFLLCNVSHFGDTRVTAPMKHDRMNLLKIKGGNTQANPIVVLSTDIDIASLRNFQLLADKDQEKGIYKPLPPSFDRDIVRKRECRFIFESKDFVEDFLSKLGLDLLGYSSL